MKSTRILEIILPKYLQESTAKLNLNKDLIIDISAFPEKPLRCTISCMHMDEFDNFFSFKVVDTSIIESSNMFIHNNRYWAWTIRISKYDDITNDTKFILFLPGNVRWPTLSRSIFNYIKKYIKKIYNHIKYAINFHKL